jgi:S1-C subfamily serine protease
MSAILLIVLGGLSIQTRAPVPPEAPPDPLARGFMGITVTTGSLTIDSVQPKLPAEKAGLRAGDAIVRIGTLEPTSFDQVIAHITSFRPGAVVEIEVQRGNERKTFKVKLAPRPADIDLQRSVPVPFQPDE